MLRSTRSRRSTRIMPDELEQRECPLCGATMRLKETQVTSQVPGNPKPTTRLLREWRCPDCENFEEAEKLGKLRPDLARADGQQDFFPKGFLELGEIERRL